MASGGQGGYGSNGAYGQSQFNPYKSSTVSQPPVYTAPVPVPGISSKQWGGTIGKPPNGLNYPYGGPGTPPDNGNLPPWLSGADGGPGIPPNNGNLPPGLSGVDGGYGGLKSGIQPYTPPASFNPAPDYSQVMADHAAEMGAAGFGTKAAPVLGAPVGPSAMPAQTPNFVWNGVGAKPDVNAMGFNMNDRTGANAARYFRYWAQNPMTNPANQTSMQDSLAQFYRSLPPTAFK